MEKWLKIAMEIQSLAQNGLEYVNNVYDKERYERLRDISAEMINIINQYMLMVYAKYLFCVMQQEESLKKIQKLLKLNIFRLMNFHCSQKKKIIKSKLKCALEHQEMKIGKQNLNKNGLLALKFYDNDKAAETLQLLLDYGIDLDMRTNVGYGVDESIFYKYQLKCNKIIVCNV